MTQHPTDEAKNRAEVLAALEFLCGKINGYQNAKDILKTALSATDAPIVEGSDTAALFKTIKNKLDEICPEMEVTQRIATATTLSISLKRSVCAQGRTQSEIDTRQVNLNNLRERLQTCTAIVKKYAPQYCGHHTDYEGDGAVYHETAWQLFNENGDALIYTVDQIINEYDHLSAAPPVTGGADCFQSVINCHVVADQKEDEHHDFDMEIGQKG